MAQVSVKINGNRYSLACRDGEEAQLQRLCEEVDGRVMDLASRIGQIGDTRLLLMAALTLADELNEAREGGAAAPAPAGIDPAPLVTMIDDMEAIVARLESA